MPDPQHCLLTLPWRVAVWGRRCGRPWGRSCRGAGVSPPRSRTPGSAALPSPCSRIHSSTWTRQFAVLNVLAIRQRYLRAPGSRGVNQLAACCEIPHPPTFLLRAHHNGCVSPLPNSAGSLGMRENTFIEGNWVATERQVGRRACQRWILCCTVDSPPRGKIHWTTILRSFF